MKKTARGMLNIISNGMRFLLFRESFYLALVALISKSGFTFEYWHCLRLMLLESLKLFILKRRRRIAFLLLFLFILFIWNNNRNVVGIFLSWSFWISFRIYERTPSRRFIFRGWVTDGHHLIFLDSQL